MNFEITDERRMLAESLRRFLADQSPVEARVGSAYAAPWHDAAAWNGLRDLGVLHALLPEDKGGMGGTGFDIAVVFEEIGRALCPAPVLPALMAARLYAGLGEVPDKLLNGGCDVAVAIGEPDAPYDLGGIACTATACDGPGGYALSGRKSLVYGAATAEVFLVAARLDGRIALFEVTPEGSEVAAYGLIDGGSAGELFLDRSPARLVREEASGALDEVLDLGRLALCAEALGAMEAMLGYLTGHLRTRRQFGQPLAAFQALQHRVVDLLIEVEQARSIVILAAAAEGTEGFAHRIAQAKHLVGRIAQKVAEEAIQMHGGIGITWDYPPSHYAKRLVMIDAQLGDTDWHLERLMAALAAE